MNLFKSFATLLLRLVSTAICLIGLGLGGTVQTLAAISDNQQLTLLAKPVGRLDMALPGKQYSSCTASVISRSLILTAFECSASNGPIRAMRLLMGYNNRTAKDSRATSYDVDPVPVQSSKKLGYAILRVYGNPGDIWGRIAFSDRSPYSGDDLSIVLYHEGGTKRTSRCKAIKKTGRRQNDASLFQHQCDRYKGSNGAPIFNTRGKFVGINIIITRSGKVGIGKTVNALAETSKIIAELKPARRLKKRSFEWEPFANKESSSKPRRPVAARKGFSLIDVFYATDRKDIGSAVQVLYGGKQTSKITYGLCTVSIPGNHQTGKLEDDPWPIFSVKELRFIGDQNKYVVLKKIKRMQKSQYFARLRKAIQKSPNEKAFVFVHGFNVSFDDAARRTAQMAFDLGYNGVPVFYSWPSANNVLSYSLDEKIIKKSAYKLRVFLKDFIDKSTAKEVFLIAHSMGTRAMTSAVISLITENPAYNKRIKGIILAAPDIDAEVFRTSIAPAITHASDNITLYTNSDDKALSASSFLHGGKPRAGDGGDNLLVLDGIETVDATGVDTSFLSHSYFSETKSVITDMIGLIRYNQPAARRQTVIAKQKSGNKFWSIFTKPIAWLDPNNLIPTVKKNRDFGSDQRTNVGNVHFRVEVKQLDAVVKIMNIKAVYRDGIELSPGSYHILVEKEGYVKWDKWIKISGKNYRYVVDLTTSSQGSGKSSNKNTQTAKLPWLNR